MSRTTQFLSLLLVLPLAGFSGSARAAAQATDGDLVMICHHPDSQPPFEIMVDEAAAQAHIALHGDFFGFCEGIPTE